jgi:putative membrane protein
MLAARHYHHLLDGAVLTARVPRPVHILVALDWAENRRQRRWMERACAAARWPVILRPESTGRSGGYAAAEVGRYLRSGLRDAAALLRDGRVLAIFPEGHPVVDRPAPHAPNNAHRTAAAGGVANRTGTVTAEDVQTGVADRSRSASRDADGFLPFAAGFRTVIGLARRAGSEPIAVVPVGFRYEARGRRWRITARFGAPLADDAELATVESAVRELSR